MLKEERLPDTGSWPYPIYGELGFLAEEDGKAQCHICGQWFQYLGGTHLIRLHGLSCDEYRAYFGLSRNYPLAGTLFRDKQRLNHKERIKVHACKGIEKIMAQTPEERSAIRRSRTSRLSTNKRNSNHQREEDMKERFVERMCKQDIRNKASASLKNTYSDPALRQVLSERGKAIPHEKRQEMLRKSLEARQSPIVKEKERKAKDAFLNSEKGLDFKSRQSERLKEKWADPEVKQRQSEEFRRNNPAKSPEARSKMSAARKHYFQDPKNREHLSNVVKQQHQEKKADQNNKEPSSITGPRKF